MRVRLLLFGLCSIAAVVPTALLAAGHDPRIGNWVERKGTASYQGLRRSFEDLGSGMVRVNIALDPQGKARSFAEVTCDGQPRPVRNADPEPAMTLACRSVDERTTEFAFTRAAASGWVKSAGREQVSPDGSTMTVSAVQRDANGVMIARIARVFDRAP